MAFDPSVISDIGSSGPDITGSIAKGFQLKDLINDEQMGQLKLSSAKQSAADESTAKSIFKGSDISTEKGIAEASEKLTRAGQPDKAMELRKYGQQAASGELDNQIKQLDVAEKSQGAIVGIIDPIVAKADEMRRGGSSDAMIQAFIQAQTPLAMQQIQQANLPPQAMKQIMGQLGQGPLSYDKLKSFETSSKSGLERIKSRQEELKFGLAEKAQATKDASESEKERHDRSTETTANTRTAVAAKKAEGFDDRQSELLASFADRSISLPAGLRSQQQIKSTIDGLFAKHPDLTADQIADGIKSGKLKLTAETAASRTAGNQIGKVSLASNELNTFGQQVLEASSKVPRGIWGDGKNLTINGLVQSGEKQFSDPALLRLKAKLQALNNAYDQLSARGGIDKDKREHIHELFQAKLSDEGIKTLVQALNEEASGASEAANRTIAETSGSSIPGTGKGTDHPSDIQSLLNKYK